MRTFLPSLYNLKDARGIISPHLTFSTAQNFPILCHLFFSHILEGHTWFHLNSRSLKLKTFLFYLLTGIRTFFPELISWRTHDVSSFVTFFTAQKVVIYIQQSLLKIRRLEFVFSQLVSSGTRLILSKYYQGNQGSSHVHLAKSTKLSWVVKG